MAFENIETWGVAWGYIFVVVIAGLALLVGKRKLDKRKEKKAKVDTKVETDTAKPTESPELEKVDNEPKSKTEDQNGKESEKTE